MKILFFSPFQAIPAHTYPEALLARTLIERGHEVVFAGCDKLFSRFCIAHSAYSLTDRTSEVERLRICRQCISSRSKMNKTIGGLLLLDKHITEDEFQKTESITNALNKENINSLEVNGYHISKIASYEFILNNKIADINLMTTQQIETFKIYISNTLKTMFAIERIFEIDKIDRVILYNACYSFNNMTRQCAMRRKIPVASIHGGPNLKHVDNTLYFTWLRTIEFDRYYMNFFLKNYDSLDLDFSRYMLPLDHLKTILKAKSVFTYSSGKASDLKGLIDRLEFKSEHKKIVLLSMSSSDEAYAADYAFMEGEYLGRAKRIFADHLIWIQKVTDHFSTKSDCKLIIRLHPRELPNKREGLRSTKVEQYEKFFKTLPDNVVIDHPDAKNSIYDIYEIIDLHLFAQSTTGCESAMLGIPGIGCISGIGGYPIEFLNEMPTDLQNYFTAIDSALAGRKKHSLETIEKTFRWYLYFYNNVVLEYSTGNFWANANDQSFFSKVIRRLRKEIGFPPISLDRYLSFAKFSKEEEDVFIQAVEKAEEISKIKKVQTSIVSLNRHGKSNIQYFNEYLRELYKTFYGFSVDDPTFSPPPESRLGAFLKNIISKL